LYSAGNGEARMAERMEQGALIEGHIIEFGKPKEFLENGSSYYKQIFYKQSVDFYRVLKLILRKCSFLP